MAAPMLLDTDMGYLDSAPACENMGTAGPAPEGYGSESMPPPLGSSELRQIVHFDMTHDEGKYWAYSVLYHGKMYLRRGHEVGSPYRGERYLEEFAAGRCDRGDWPIPNLPWECYAKTYRTFRDVAKERREGR